MLSNSCNRTYIFRGKRVSDGAWVYGNLILAENYCCILEKEEDVHPVDYPYLDGELGWIDGKATPVDPGTVSQYIMGDDLNGQMIFEGDIVKINSKWDYEWKVEPAVVIDKNSITQNGLGRRMSQDTIEVEVVGNIWDNRDMLLERDKKWVDNYYQLMEWGYTGRVIEK